MSIKEKSAEADAIPVSVVDEMIAELQAETEIETAVDDYKTMMEHGIIVLQVLKGRWERMKEHDEETG